MLEGHTLLRSVWTYIRKTTPDGNVYRHRPRFCADGSAHKYDLDCNEAYFPVVRWSTRYILFILGKTLDWPSRKADYVQVFPHAKLDDNTCIYIHLLRRIQVDDAQYRSDYVLELKEKRVCIQTSQLKLN